MIPSNTSQSLLYLYGLLLAALAIFVFRSRPRSTSHRWFALHTVLLTIWTIAIAEVHGNYALEFWGRLTFAATSLVPPTFLAFSRHFPSTVPWLRAGFVQVMGGIGVVFAVASIASPLIAYDFSTATGELSRKTGPLYPAFGTFFLSCWSVSIAVLLKKWRAEGGRARAQLQFVVTGVVLAEVLGITTNLLLPALTGRSTYTWLGPNFVLIHVAFVAHGIIRHRLLDLRVIIRRGLTVAVATVASLLPVLVALGFLWPHLTGRLSPEEFAILILTVIVATLAVPTTRDFAERVLDHYVYRARVNYQYTLRYASSRLTRVLQLNSLIQFVHDLVMTSAGSEGVAIYVKVDGEFVRKHEAPTETIRGFQAPERLPAAILEYLRTTDDCVVMNEIGQNRSQRFRAVHDHLAALDWAVVLPVMFEDAVLGAIAVGPKRSGDPFYPHDLDLLMTLANQAGIAVKNAQLYTEVVLANEYVQNIVATIESGVVAVNPGGRVTMFNRAAERLTALRADQVTGDSVSAVPDVLGTLLRTTLDDGQARTEPEIALQAGPTTRPVICTTSPLRDPGGAILGAVAVFSDLTPLKELEAERQRVERLAYFEVLASSIAHEIKNPVVAIKTFTQLIPRRLHDHAFLENFSRVVSREIERMERLVERFRRLSRPSSQPQYRLDVRQPLTEAVEFLKPAFDERNVALTLAPGSEPRFVVGDDGELHQLFVNLLMNAHEATPRGGTVEVELTATDRAVVVTVADSGPGIPPERLRQLFDPFFTTKARGSGLGLTISADIVAGHRAKLRASNRPAGGALFTVEFPAATVEATTTRVNTGG